MRVLNGFRYLVESVLVRMTVACRVYTFPATDTVSFNLFGEDP